MKGTHSLSRDIPPSCQLRTNAHSGEVDAQQCNTPRPNLSPLAGRGRRALARRVRGILQILGRSKVPLSPQAGRGSTPSLPLALIPFIDIRFRLQA
jgi:hypothetical protein